MINGMHESSRGCIKEELRMDIISSNLANINVVGFKKDRVSFQRMLNQASAVAGAPSNVTVKPDMEQGDIRATGNELDIAIKGRGFFKINTENGIRYTRKGNFSLDIAGTLVTQNGNTVMGKTGPIQIVGNDISIDEAGNIHTDAGKMGEIDIVDFENYDGLIKTGASLFNNTLEHPEIDLPSGTTISQGYTELSNVNAAEEMISMIQSLRAFESFQKSMRVIDDLNNKAINQVGRLR
jgi:flagellar basal-body rod protein FlgG